MIVKTFDALLLELEIVITEDRLDPATVDNAPSIVKLPDPDNVSASTKPSVSLATEFKPFIINAVDAVPACDVEIKFILLLLRYLKKMLISAYAPIAQLVEQLICNQ